MAAREHFCGRECSTTLHSEFNSYQRHTVVYLGVPYSDARFVDGVWYFCALDGRIAKFCFQEQVLMWQPEPQREGATNLFESDDRITSGSRHSAECG
jgi:hypothetical protein